MKKSKKKKICKIIYTLLVIAALFLLEQTNIINLNELNNNEIVLTSTKVSDKSVVTLSSCVDGDTAKFNINDEEIKVRFLAIDTPETVHPYKSVEKYGKDASEYTCKMLTNATKIEIQYEDTSAKTDKYDRSLVWVWVDDELLQKQLVSIGYAKVRYVYAKYMYTDELIEAQNLARQQKNGMWYDYEEEKYDSNNEYIVTFKYGDISKNINIKEGSIIDLIDNPVKDGYEFQGWKYNGKLYDTVTPTERDITLSASFSKLK